MKRGGGEVGKRVKMVVFWLGIFVLVCGVCCSSDRLEKKVSPEVFVRDISIVARSNGEDSSDGGCFIFLSCFVLCCVCVCVCVGGGSGGKVCSLTFWVGLIVVDV